jgi:hypothetical protein
LIPAIISDIEGIDQPKNPIMSNNHVKVVPSVYSGQGKDGDFGWMITQGQYAKSFFIFNDNEGQFLENRTSPKGPGACADGGGNAAIRSSQCETPPRALGIPTGSYTLSPPGYPALTPQVQQLIDDAIASIKQVVQANGYTEVIYSGDGHGGLGHGIFNPAAAVKKYIITQINSLSSIQVPG